MLTAEQFCKHLSTRRETATMETIGREFGVTRQCVYGWLKGHPEPSPMALILAEHLWRTPVDLAPGLPADPDDRG